MVEKMRRDRINGCIEQLKVLLEKEFRERDPNAKLEKADVLEMTVVFMKQRLQPLGPNAGSAHSDGYSRCWEETLRFLARSSPEEAATQRLRHLGTAQDAAPLPALSSHVLAEGKQQSGPPEAVWRPW